MPKLEVRTRNRGGDRTYTCERCREPVLPGEQFYTWAFRYGGRRCQHVKCGRPKRSQLTQSIMGEVYDAIDEAEAVDGDLAAFADAVDALVETARSVQEQYAAAAEAFGGAGENQERADQLDAWIDELDGKAEEIRQALDAYESAKSAVGECPL